MNFEILSAMPTPKEYVELRALVGWGEVDLEVASKGLERSLFNVSARLGSRLVGMGRVVGDGAMFFYIQDLVVAPEFQNKGLGKRLMDQIEIYISQVAVKGATVGLFSAQGKESFYMRYEYIKRTGEDLGLGMCKFI
ncbi:MULTISPECIES: GNAT family N-acetyltransferase [unclassified Pseudoalteromonas]|uniref:GNAT family N-acetyltransferase n=1 Tax=unclassified Pseudoalteromonas TaxID=194690 RepID=UPI00202AF3DB|nr:MULTISPECIES: GNAT family N-acetyltransferase [unclassified Pseudoalteromonas]MCH2087288.1 GNAT family N-acetyltransferase [Pseudoalteromonas sp.]URQ90872.1 GNAT family N-acetyltransferase [Pseudoalteromonas sp. SCSIO 43101]